MASQLTKLECLVAHSAIECTSRLDGLAMRAETQLSGCGNPRDGEPANLARVLDGALGHRVHESVRWPRHAGWNPTIRVWQPAGWSRHFASALVSSADMKMFRGVDATVELGQLAEHRDLPDQRRAFWEEMELPVRFDLHLRHCGGSITQPQGQ